MKNIWETRNKNIERHFNSQETFKFILDKMGENHSNNLLEEDFTKILQTHKETITPRIGDIIAIQENYLWPNTIYAGIILNGSILTKENNEIIMQNKDDFLKKYTNKRTQVKYYKTNKNYH